jgi:hypothetical protein
LQAPATRISEKSAKAGTRDLVFSHALIKFRLLPPVVQILLELNPLEQKGKAHPTADTEC